jgi:hypothetical protein
MHTNSKRTWIFPVLWILVMPYSEVTSVTCLVKIIKNIQTNKVNMYISHILFHLQQKLHHGILCILFVLPHSIHCQANILPSVLQQCSMSKTECLTCWQLWDQGIQTDDGGIWCQELLPSATLGRTFFSHFLYRNQLKQVKAIVSQVRYKIQLYLQTHSVLQVDVMYMTENVRVKIQNAV